MQSPTCGSCRYSRGEDGGPLICFGRPPTPMLVPIPPTVATRGQQGVAMQSARPWVMKEEPACGQYEMKLSAMS